MDARRSHASALGIIEGMLGIYGSDEPNTGDRAIEKVRTLVAKARVVDALFSASVSGAQEFTKAMQEYDDSVAALRALERKAGM